MNSSPKEAGRGKKVFLVCFVLLISLLVFSSLVYAWANNDYEFRIFINCSAINENQAFVVNGTNGVILTGDPQKQFIETNCNTSGLYLYYNDYSDYIIGTDGRQYNHEVIKGNGTSYNPTAVYNTSYIDVWHFETRNPTLDSTGRDNLTAKNYTNTSNCLIGGCIGKFGFDKYGLQTTANMPASVRGSDDRSFLVLLQIRKIDTASSRRIFYQGSDATNAQFTPKYGNTNKTDIGFWGSDISAAGGWSGNPNDWRFMVYTINASQIGMISNGAHYGASPYARNPATAASPLYIGSYGDGGEPWNGTIDELIVYDQVMPLDLINQIYNNYLGIAPYGTTGAEEVIPLPTITLDLKQPSDFSSLNIVALQSNISYNTTYLNNSLAKLFYKTNSTALTNIAYFINGVAYSGYFNKSCVNDTANHFKCELDDNEILPATYNYNEDTLESTSHSAIATLSNSNSYASIEFLNVSGTRQYSFLELMSNSTYAGYISIYYCNSSYITGAVDTSQNCAIVGSFIGNSTYNHIHNVNSQHRIISLAMNSGYINGVAITPKSYFILAGINSQTINIYGISAFARAGTLKTSTNHGVSWSNITGTADAHLHQFDSDTTFYFYGCSNIAENNTEICSSVGSDVLAQDYLPPITPSISPMPTPIKRYSIISVNWTESISPIGEDISNYSLTLRDTDGLYMSDIAIEITNLTYNYNASQLDGYYYRLGVVATDVLNGDSAPGLTNAYYICTENYTCVSYAGCTINNNSACEEVTDFGCGFEFTGNLSDFDRGCVYVYSADITITDYDLTQEQNYILYGLLIFFWLGLNVLAFTFKNKAFGIFAFIVGIILGMMSLMISPILTLAFIFINILLSIGSFSKFH